MGRFWPPMLSVPTPVSKIVLFYHQWKNWFYTYNLKKLELGFSRALFESLGSLLYICKLVNYLCSYITICI
ncbi:hypothetical protein HanIR_Chr12g0595761 [Helianthus annuus]|nr:hypothetical protein HanIR_Chr12g0595761 [Helianthus annuus]